MVRSTLLRVPPGIGSKKELSKIWRNATWHLAACKNHQECEKLYPNGCSAPRDPPFWTMKTRGRRNLFSYARKYADSRMNLDGLGTIYNNNSICKGFAEKHVCMGVCGHPNVPLHLSDGVDQECMGCRGRRIQLIWIVLDSGQ